MSSRSIVTGDFMNTATQEESSEQPIGWGIGIVGVLLLISLGLELCARQVFGHTDVGTLLWALYLGFLSFVLGATGFLLLAGQWLVEWQHVGRNKITMSRQRRSSHPLLNSMVVNQNRMNAEPCAQAREPETAVTCS